MTQSVAPYKQLYMTHITYHTTKLYTCVDCHHYINLLTLPGMWYISWPRFMVLCAVTTTDRSKHEGVAFVFNIYKQVKFELWTSSSTLWTLFLSLPNSQHIPRDQIFEDNFSVTFLLPSYPENPGCCPATCRGSHQRKGQRYQLQVHNTTLQTWPGTIKKQLVIVKPRLSSMR